MVAFQARGLEFEIAVAVTFQSDLVLIETQLLLPNKQLVNNPIHYRSFD